MSRRPLDEKVLALIAEGVDRPPDDSRFEPLALEVFRYQYEHNPPYRRLCDSFGRAPRAVSRWQEIPAVPTGAFKQARLATFPPEAELRTFRTSGSTGDARGELHLDTLELYEASLLATFGAFICPEALAGGPRLRILALAPSATQLPDSSLSYMFERAMRAFGTPESRFYAHASGWHPEPLIRDLEGLEQAVALVGTAFAFVHLLDALEARGAKLDLPPGSRIMETGGFKGRSCELDREALHGAIAAALGVPIQRIVNQYGMCELGSQFYEPALRTGERSHTKRVPPWVRTRVVDPATLRDVPEGGTGVLMHYDLANTGSVLAVETSDEGRLADEGFEVGGRIAGAEARGCSIAADAILSGCVPRTPGGRTHV